VHDPGESDERGIGSQPEVLYQYLEAAHPVTVRELGSGRVERACALAARDVEDLVGANVEDLGVGVDEPADQPGKRYGRSSVVRA